MRTRSSFKEDERAVETLPIRLVIALVVGVAAMAFMMNMISGMGQPGQNELSVSAGTQVIPSTGTSVDFTVTDDTGEPVPDAKVMIKSGTAEIDGSPIVSGETDEGGEVTGVSVNPSIDWRSDQDQGTLKVQVVPPGDSNFKDEVSDLELIIMQ